MHLSVAIVDWSQNSEFRISKHSATVILLVDRVHLLGSVKVNSDLKIHWNGLEIAPKQEIHAWSHSSFGLVMGWSHSETEGIFMGQMCKVTTLLAKTDLGQAVGLSPTVVCWNIMPKTYFPHGKILICALHPSQHQVREYLLKECCYLSSRVQRL